MKSILPTGNYPEALEIIKNLFTFPREKMELMIRDFQEEMHKGLAGTESQFKMIPTYMPLPTGNEKGYSLAIDMGGTNLRVMIVKLSGKQATPEIILSSKRELSRREMDTDAQTLFAVIAREIQKLLLQLELLNRKNNNIGSIEEVGFTFSYPVKMVNRNSGIIVALSKELAAKDLLGQDPFVLLFQALTALPVQTQLYPLSALKAAALLNDTVTELIYGAYLKNNEDSDYQCRIGGIIGTGYNFALLLDTNAILKFKEAEYPSRQMIVNIEAGNFDAASLPKTIFDQWVDQKSLKPGFYRLEKMVAGNYLGRITAWILKELIQTDNLFNANSDIIEKINNFTCVHMSLLEANYPGNQEKARELLKELGISPVMDEELSIIHEITTLVSTRAAYIAAASVAAIVLFIDPKLEQKHTIALDGSVFGKYPGYKAKMLVTLHQLLGNKAEQIKLEYISDGSGIGAAIAAKC